MSKDSRSASSDYTINVIGRERFSLTFLLLTVTFCVCLIISNLMEIKTIDAGFITLTAGMAVFPISYIINDCLVEIYGFRKARLVIYLGFFMNLLTVVLLQAGIWLPGAETWSQQEAMEAIFGATPRILCASFTAFLAGSLTNAWVMDKMKRSAYRGSRNAVSYGRFSARAIISTIWGEGIDSLIFFPIAFAGTLPWSVILSLIISQTILKTVYEVIALPLTMIFVKYLRRKECPDSTINTQI